jgi:PilZ domain
MKHRKKKDTRGHPRFNVDVEVQVKTDSGQRVTARTRDLSRSGICLITAGALDGGQPLAIELVLAFGNNAFSEPLRLDAHVVWCTAIGGHFQIGAMFDGLTPEHHDFLDMFLRFLDGTLAPKGVPPAARSGEVPEEEPTVPPDVKDDPFRR